MPKASWNRHGLSWAMKEASQRGGIGQRWGKGSQGTGDLWRTEGSGEGRDYARSSNNSAPLSNYPIQKLDTFTLFSSPWDCQPESAVSISLLWHGWRTNGSSSLASWLPRAKVPQSLMQARGIGSVSTTGSSLAASRFHHIFPSVAWLSTAPSVPPEISALQFGRLFWMQP